MHLVLLVVMFKHCTRDAECCSANANGQSCVKSLSIAAGTSELSLSNTGELSIDLSGKINGVNDPNDPNGPVLARIQTYLVAEEGFQSNKDAIFGPAATVNLEGNFVAKDATNRITVKITKTDADYGLVSDKNVLLRQGSDGKTLKMLDGQADFDAATNVIFHNMNGVKFLPTSIAPDQVCDSTGALPRTHGFISVPRQTDTGSHDSYSLQLDAGKQDQFWSCSIHDVNFQSAKIITGSQLWVGGVQITSDSRIKKDIVDVDIEDTLQKVRDIELKEYGYNDPNREGEKTVGFIAQQVKEVYPDAVHIDKNSNTIWNEAGERVEIYDLHRINKDKIFALHHGALQYLDAKIATLEALDAKNRRPRSLRRQNRRPRSPTRRP